MTQSHPHQRRPRPSYSSSRRGSDVPTPNLLLNKSEPSNSLAFSESFAAYFPKKCVKNEPKEPTEPNPFDRLSDELVVKIFSYFSHPVLTKVILVSKRFQRIGKIVQSQKHISIMSLHDFFQPVMNPYGRESISVEKAYHQVLEYQNMSPIFNLDFSQQF